MALPRPGQIRGLGEPVQTAAGRGLEPSAGVALGRCGVVALEVVDPALAVGPVAAFHGLQVGVTTLAIAKLYQIILGLSPDYIQQLASEVTLSTRETEIEAIRTYWGGMSAEIEQEFLKKQMPQPQKREELTKIARQWADIVSQITQFLRPPDELKQILQSAGAALSYKDLGISREHFTAATINARYIRARYTILDLAADIGLLHQFTTNL